MANIFTDLGHKPGYIIIDIYMYDICLITILPLRRRVYAYTYISLITLVHVKTHYSNEIML